MLQVNQQQLRGIGTARFEQRLVQLLVETAPEASGSINTPEGLRVLREQIDRARAYGFNSELDLARYAITAWLLGTKFDSRIPAYSEILRNPTLTPTQKSEAIAQVSSTVLTELAIGKRQV
jgi:hypothetical protein